ncbi:MAG: DUF6737 family protein [Xenococcaceae cyanobacterium]
MPLNKTPNPWNFKPWWCQPWSIVLTGVGAIASSWLLCHRIWLTVAVALPILVWWFYFLLLWPKLIIESGIFNEENQFIKESLTEQQKYTSK